MGKGFIVQSGLFIQKHKQARHRIVRVGLAREPCLANTLCMGVSWRAFGFGVAGGAWICCRLWYLVVVGEAGVCIARCRRRRVGCAAVIGAAGRCVLGWLLVVM
jgi:hypothetical protein